MHTEKGDVIGENNKKIATWKRKEMVSQKLDFSGTLVLDFQPIEM